MRKSETYRNEIKSYIVRTGMTMTEVVDYLSDEYGWSRSVPNLSGKLKRGSLRYGEAVELASQGILPEGMYRNRSFAECRVDPGEAELWQQDLLYDPQTSGGLLFAVDPADAATLEQELRAAGLPASIVGEILPKQEIEITVTDK